MSIERKDWINVFGVELERPEPFIRLNAPRECDHLVENPKGWGFVPCNREDTVFRDGFWLCGEHAKEREW